MSLMPLILGRPPGIHPTIDPYSPEEITSASSVLTQRLSAELLILVLKTLPICDLRNLRLVNKELEVVTAPVLFGVVVISHSSKSVVRIQGLSEHQRLREFIHRINVCNWTLSRHELTQTNLDFSRAQRGQQDIRRYMDQRWYRRFMKTRARARSFQQELNAQSRFPSRVQDLTIAFGKLPHLLEIYVGDLGSSHTIRADADIAKLTGCVQKHNDDFPSIDVHDVAAWTLGLCPEVFEANPGLLHRINFAKRDSYSQTYFSRIRKFALIIACGVLPLGWLCSSKTPSERTPPMFWMKCPETWLQ